MYYVQIKNYIVYILQKRKYDLINFNPWIQMCL